MDPVVVGLQNLRRALEEAEIHHQHHHHKETMVGVAIFQDLTVAAVVGPPQLAQMHLLQWEAMEVLALHHQFLAVLLIMPVVVAVVYMWAPLLLVLVALVAEAVAVQLSAEMESTAALTREEEEAAQVLPALLPVRVAQAVPAS